MITRDVLFKIPVPEETKTYAPVSHKAILRRVDTQLQKQGFTVRGEYFNASKNGNRVVGIMDIIHPHNTDLGMRFVWINSYDKSRAVAFAAGGLAWVCLNGLITGDIKFVRKHTGTVLQEITTKIKETTSLLNTTFVSIEKQSEQMKEITISRKAASELLGRLFVEEEILNTNQLTIVKRELIKPTFDIFRHNNLWSFYNGVTYALKSTHPNFYLATHKNFHQFIEKEFELI
jgi:hypothetical protein